MIRTLIHTSLFFIALQTLSGCTNSPNSNSGPCDYSEEKFNMFIIDVIEDSTSENMYIVLVDFDGNVSLAEETTTLSEARNVTTDYDFIVNNNIKANTTYTGTVHIKVPGSGDCEDEIIDWDQKLRK